ncbi:nickel pincer cofactor biosynthesis protein LarB [Microbacterium sp. K24]|uniref:nickel pincer cofactor biosynthesis protein LarB n=1 Tax=Microbacterium sp. K24 TaxID=2305446 RepID=UPI00109D4DCC|nr:nickel pincer cofactor biosynthesis protein LarB [Microbacterium sp. K24]
MSALTTDLGHTTVDLDRERRQGIAEVIYGAGKTATEIADIAIALLDANSGPVVATRVADRATDRILGDVFAAARIHGDFHAASNTIVWRRRAEELGRITIVTAGTTDGRVAAEAESVSDALGIRVDRINDVGVAGIHRLLAHEGALRSARLVIVVAGMEGALASVVGGLVAVPVIAVPTSTGYGSAFEGVTALLAMLSSCAAGVTVVGIDNGFGAAMAAARLVLARSTA